MVEFPRGWRRWAAAALILAVLATLGGIGVAAEPAAPLTAEQQQKLKERDRLLAEMQAIFGQNKLAEGVEKLRQVVAIERTVFGAGAEVAEWLRLLAMLQEQREDFPAAAEARKEVLAINRRLHGADDWRTMDARRELDNSVRLATWKPENRARYWRAFARNEEAVGLYGQGKFAEALLPAREAAAIRKALLGEKHPDYASNVYNLARVYQAMGAYDKALPLLEQARDVRKATLGEKHPDYAESLNSLAVLYQDMGAYDKALPLHEQARDLRKATLGDKHPLYATSLNNLALLHYARGERELSEPLVLRTLGIRRQHLNDTFTVLTDRQRLDLITQARTDLDDYLCMALAADAPAARLYDQVLAWKGVAAARTAERRLVLGNAELAASLEDLHRARAWPSWPTVRPHPPDRRSGWSASANWRPTRRPPRPSWNARARPSADCAAAATPAPNRWPKPCLPTPLLSISSNTPTSTPTLSARVPGTPNSDCWPS
jgi:tetratricopeptide (TPR) repeat protein